jgi:dinuclear metal center YbgI/SA1388 family protein
MSKTTVQHLINTLHAWAPPSTQMDYDNVGLLVGSPDARIERVLCCLDVTEEVVEEAIEYDYDVIVAHHPLIFKKLSRINPTDEIGRIIYKLIRNDKHLIASHTNLDAARGGVSFVLAETLGLTDISFLDTSYDIVKRLDISLNKEMYNTEAHRVALLTALDEHAQSYEVSTALSTSDRRSITAWLDDYAVRPVQQALREIPGLKMNVQDTDERSADVGMGAIGSYEEGLDKEAFLSKVSDALNVKAIRYSGSADTIKTVAVCGGAGVFLSRKAAASGADAFVTGDIKYHDYFTDQEDFLLVDVGHFESEIPIVPVLKRHLKQVHPKLNVAVTKVVTNPMKIFTNATIQSTET